MSSFQRIGRRRLHAWLALLICSGFSNQACQPVPHPEWNGLEELRAELQRHRSGEYLPLEYEEFNLAFDQTQLRFRQFQVQNSLTRDLTALRQELGERSLQGRRILGRTLAMQDELRRRQAEQLQTLSENLVAVAGTLHPVLRRQATALAIQLSQVRDLWTRREYLQVESLLETAHTAMNELEAGFRQAGIRLTDAGWIERWRSWSHQTILWSRTHRKTAVIIDKQRRLALVFRAGQPTREFPIELGWNAPEDKLRAGDGATPEGRYKVVKKKGQGETSYFRALLLDYPNQEDRLRFEQARKLGEIEPEAHIGGMIEIHGDGGRGTDWTQGCVALDNSQMKELFELAYAGMPVTIVGRFEP